MSCQLIVIQGPDQGQVIDLPASGEMLIGRGGDCDVQLNDPRTSRVHVRIVSDETGAILRDAGSSYGTLISGKKVAEHRLKHGEVFELGDTQIRFVDDAAKASDTLPPTGSSPQAADSGPKLGAGKGLRDLVGKTLARYEIRDAIAEGRTGMVFRAFEPQKDREVALKVLWPELAQKEEEVQRFIRAIKTMLPLKHPNLVQLYRAGKNGDFCWMAMEFVDGESVAKVIERIGVGGMLDWEQAFRVALHISRGLEVAYDNKIVHRNITPSNILIRESDNTVKLGDLMLAKALEGTQAATITRPGEIIGELAYLSPEQTSGEKNYDGRSDIYNLGATVYRLLTGRPPVEGKNPADTIVKIQSEDPEPPTKYQLSVPPLFEGIVVKMLAKRPEERFQNPTSLIRDLERTAKYQGLENL